MKNIYLIILLFILTGCVNNIGLFSYTDEIIIQDANCANTQSITRGVPVTTSNLLENYTDYTLYAYDNSNKCYINNESYTYNNGKFISQTQYYWSDSDLNFWMYPSNQDYTSIVQNSNDIEFSYNHPSNGTSDGVDSKDILFAYTSQSPYNLVDITFQHALASIKIMYGSIQAAHHITHIEISNINISGDCVFNKDETFTWSNQVKGSYGQDFDTRISKDNIEITSDDKTFFVVPGKGFTIDITLDNGRHVSKEFADWDLTSGVCSHIVINDKLNPGTGEDWVDIVDPEDVPTNKTINENPDGTYYITIEAYVTGKIIKKTTVTEKPIDFVIVLDVSGSMAYDMNGNSTNVNANKRINILKNAVSAFADTIAAHSIKYNVEHRVALVKFAGNSNNNVGNNTYNGYNYSQLVNHFTTDMNTIKSNVNSLNAAGGTRISSGMYYAKQEFANSRTDAEKICIVFTDGGPGDYGWSYWNRGGNSAGDTKYEAKNAVKYAYDMKTDGVKIYSVGVFTDDDTDSDEFMNRISSNYLDATTFDKTTTYKGWSSKTTYSDGTKTSSDYYTNTTTADALISTFGQIAAESASGGASVELSEESYAYDVISDIFDLPSNYGENEGDIKFYSVAQTGYNIATKEITWSSERVDITSQLTWSYENYALKVKGWDYSANCCGEGCTGTGHKLVLVINNLKIKDNIEGKNYTNQYGSGLYDSEGNLIISFDSPYIEI